MTLHERLEITASRLYRFRYYFIGAALAIFAALYWLVRAQVSPSGTLPRGTWTLLLVGMAAALIAWQLAVVGFWFHPERGALRRRTTDTPLRARLREGERWFASVMIVLFCLAVPIIVWMGLTS